MNKDLVKRIQEVIDQIDEIIGEIHVEIAPRVRELEGAPHKDLYVKESQLFQLTEANSALRAFLEIDGVSVEEYIEMLEKMEIDPVDYNTNARISVMEYHFLKEPDLKAKLFLDGLLSLLK